MKKIIIFLIFFFTQISNINAETSDKIKRITVGNKNANITIDWSMDIKS